ncbi:MAG TPA: GntR family transcriptional regulator [Pseudonocardiaceae bacterium]|jgi:DNA-binding GntR family transcriptional regulator|nr:GntR family transcriptional regulator [Pseudonocardiaceae bacterium]
MPEMLSLPASRTELVLEEIRRAILTRELLPGQQLVEMELAQRLGVSKTPVREALKVLSGSGLVTFSPYKGASVRTVDADLAQNVFDLRLLLEPEAVERSVRHREPEEFAEAAGLLEQANTAGAKSDHAELSLLNRAFHRALYAGCGNPLLVGILDELRDRAALLSVVGWDANHSWDAEWDEHRAILRAAQDGRPAAAAELLRAHIEGFRARIMPAIAAAENA